MAENHLRSKELTQYVDGLTKGEARLRVERHLKSCGQCFQVYMEMRENIFLLKGKEKIPERLRAHLLQEIKQNVRNHLAIFLRFQNNRVTLFTGEQNSLRLQGIKATFALRDAGRASMSSNQEGPVSITRTINGREVTLTIHPLPGREKMTLSIAVRPPERLAARVLFDGEVCETVTDISAQSMLTTEFPQQGMLDMFFERDGETVFSISLQLESE